MNVLNPYAWLAALVAIAAFVAGGYGWGSHAANNACLAAQAKQQKAQATALAKEQTRADQAATAYLQEHLDQEDRYAKLDAAYSDLRRSHPLVVARTVGVPRAAPHAAQAPIAPSQPGASAAAPLSAAEPQAGGDPGLTLAAVRLWNGALRGADAPAGACGLAGAAQGADAACAQDSGLTLDDAWRNQGDNARTCAADRARYQRLIDFLNAGKE